MTTPTYNDAETNGLSKLEFGPSGMGGLLSSTGVTCRVTPDPIDVSSVTFAPPGADWMGHRVLGKHGRAVRWETQLKCDDNASLNAVEAAIEAYLNDGRAYALTDGFGRSNSYAILQRAGTGRRDRRVPLQSGAVLQRWGLVFLVLWPQVGATSL